MQYFIGLRYTPCYGISPQSTLNRFSIWHNFNLNERRSWLYEDISWRCDCGDFGSGRYCGLVPSIPAKLLLGGALAIYLGVDELKDTWKEAETPVSDPAPSEDVEKYKKEIDELKEEIETLKKD